MILRRSCGLCYNASMHLPPSRIGWILLPVAVILGLSGLAVAAQSGLFEGTLEPEGGEYAAVVWTAGGLLFLGGTCIIILNLIKKNHSG